jgi:histidinol-phosphate/aromatic aminotransferase/cobyric acid decarboxylase-like protein
MRSEEARLGSRVQRAVKELHMADEKDRFYSRLALIPGVQPMPSIGDWILLRVRQPNEVARKLTRRLVPGLVSVPRHIEGAVRLMVSDPKTNERVLRALREAVA